MVASRESRQRIEAAREADKREAAKRKAEERRAKDKKEREAELADARALLAQREQRQANYEPQKNLSPQSAERARRRIEQSVIEAKAEVQRLERKPASADPSDILDQTRDFIDRADPTDFEFGSASDLEPYEFGPRGNASLDPAAVLTGDPVIDAMVPGGVGGAVNLQSDPLDIFLGLDADTARTARVYQGSSTQTDQQRWADRVKDYIPAAVDDTKTVGDLFQQFYALDGEEFRDLQYNLFVGGFFGDVDPRSIAWGMAGDEATNQAWQQAVVRSARFYAANKKLTVDDVIGLAAKAAGAAGPGGAGHTPVTVSLTDPASLSDTIDAAAHKVLGRKATADERRMFVAAMHDSERTSQTKAQTANDFAGQQGREMARVLSTDGSPIPDNSFVNEVMGVSPESRADDFARNLDPVKADARKVVNAASVLSQMLKGQI